MNLLLINGQSQLTNNTHVLIIVSIVRHLKGLRHYFESS